MHAARANQLSDDQPRRAAIDRQVDGLPELIFAGMDWHGSWHGSNDNTGKTQDFSDRSVPAILA